MKKTVTLFLALISASVMAQDYIPYVTTVGNVESNGVAVFSDASGRHIKNVGSAYDATLIAHQIKTGTNVHGLGTASTASTTNFDAAGSATAVSNYAAATFGYLPASLSNHVAATGTNVHGLGTMAVRSTNDFTLLSAFNAYTNYMATLVQYTPTNTLASTAYTPATTYVTRVEWIAGANPKLTLGEAANGAHFAFTNLDDVVLDTGKKLSDSIGVVWDADVDGNNKLLTNLLDVSTMSGVSLLSLYTNVMFNPTNTLADTAYIPSTNFVFAVDNTNVFVDAPSDGLSYWRKDGGWTNLIVLPVPASREVLLTVTPNTNNISAVSLFTRADAGQAEEIGGVRNTVGLIPQPGDTKETALELVNGSFTNFLAVDWATVPVASVGKRGGARYNLATESYVTNALAGITNTGSGTFDHAALTNLQGDVSYQHITTAQVARVDAAISLADSTNATMNLLTNGEVSAKFLDLKMTGDLDMTNSDAYFADVHGAFHGDGSLVSNIPVANVGGALSNIIVNGVTGSVANGVADVTIAASGGGMTNAVEVAASTNYFFYQPTNSTLYGCVTNGGAATLDTNTVKALAQVEATNAVNASAWMPYNLASAPTNTLTLAMGRSIRLALTNTTYITIADDWPTNQIGNITLSFNAAGQAYSWATSVVSGTTTLVIPTNGPPVPLYFRHNIDVPYASTPWSVRQ